MYSTTKRDSWMKRDDPGLDLRQLEGFAGQCKMEEMNVLSVSVFWTTFQAG